MNPTITVVGPATAQMIDTILVIEDDPGIRTLVVAVLDNEGMACVSVENGAAAIRWLHEHRPSLVILDLHMPEVPGEGVLQALLALYGVTMPVITMATPRSGMLPRRKLGAWTHLRMPFRLDEMLHAVYSHL